MHRWGDDDVDWGGINEAASYIGLWLRRWARVDVLDYKEKYGTVRVYCSLGWSNIHDVTHPGHSFTQYKQDSLLWRLNYAEWPTHVFQALNLVVVPVHARLYRWRYKRAVKRWPRLRCEILNSAAYSELLVGL